MIGRLCMAVAAMSLLAGLPAVAQETDPLEGAYEKLKDHPDRAVRRRADNWRTLTAERLWKDSTGQYSVNARYVDHDEKLAWVKLKKADGNEVVVPLDKLGEREQNVVRAIAGLRPRIVEDLARPDHAAPEPGAADLPATKEDGPSGTEPKEGPSPPDLKELQPVFTAFVKAPTGENYLKALKAVTSNPKYEYSPVALTMIAQAVESGQLRQAQQQLAKAMPALMLSPRAHRFASMAAKGLGDARTAKQEAEIAAACLKGIQATGDGTAERPYAVSCVEDEYDLLGHLGKQLTRQSLRSKDGKHYDVLDCTDGSSLWFDISAFFGR